MNRTIAGILIGLVLGSAGTVLYLRYVSTGQEQPAEPSAEEALLPHQVESARLVKLDREAQSRMGLKVEPLAGVQMAPQVQGYGRVLDPAPLAALVTEAASAQTALEASTREFERVQALYAHNQNASARALETAQTAMKRDQIALASVQSRLLLDWGQAVAAQADLSAFVHSLAVREAALVRVDVPLGEPLPAAPLGGHIAPLVAPERLTGAQYLSPAPSANPQFQGRGFLLLVKGDGLLPGTAVLATLTVPGPPHSGVVVPPGAIVRVDSKSWAYLQTDAETFVRSELTLDRPLSDGRFAVRGLPPGARIVTKGVQMLLSEEQRYRIEMQE